MSPRHRRPSRGSNKQFLPRRALPRRALLFLVVGALLWAVDAYRDRSSSPPEAAPSSTSRSSSAASAAGEQAILEAYRDHRSGFFVETEGVVSKLLRDDEEGSRHQRFILRLGQGHTVLVSHNIDLAPRMPAQQGDRVQVRGKYEWNDRGGVIHWTHHDPRGRQPGGWIRVGGEEFR